MGHERQPRSAARGLGWTAVLTLGLLAAHAGAAPILYGQEVTVYATVTGPSEIEFAPDGALFAAHNSPSNGAARLYRIPPGGGAAVEWGSASPQDPDGIDVYGGKVYAAAEDHVWQGDLATGAMATWTTWSGGRNMTTIAVDKLGDYGDAGDVVIGSARYGNDIELISATTRQTTMSVSSGDLYVPRGLLFATGTLYCVESSATEGIWAIGPAGGLTRVSDGGFAWGSPSALLYDPVEDVFYVADNGRDEILRVPRVGGTPVVVGTGFTEVYGLAMGGDGRIYVADTTSNVVWVAIPEPTTIALLSVGLLLPVWRRRRRQA